MFHVKHSEIELHLRGNRRSGQAAQEFSFSLDVVRAGLTGALGHCQAGAGLVLLECGVCCRLA